MNEPMNILVVDDNRQLASSLADIIEENGYAVFQAYDGMSAVETCRSRSFDLVILDYKLPDIDGLEVQQQLFGATDADFLIITAHASIESAAEAVRRGNIVGYETKPLDMPRLLAFIRQIHERRRAEAKVERQAEEIRAALAEKETLLRELHHRVKNNMQLISSMISLQKTSVQDKTAKNILLELEDKIRTMALVHQKLYQSENLAEIDLREYIRDLICLLVKSHGLKPDAAEMRLDIENTPIPINTAIPIGIVLNELISNAFKHAFKDGGAEQLAIGLSRTESGDIELTYADNGIGLPPDFDFRGQKTLGIQSIFLIVEHQLNGTVEFDGSNGLTCRMRFRNDEYQSNS